MTPQDGPEAPKRSPEMPQDEPRRLKRPQNSQSNARTVDGSSVHSRHRLRRPGRIIFAQYSSYQYPPVTLTANNFLWSPSGSISHVAHVQRKSLSRTGFFALLTVQARWRGLPKADG